MKIVMIEVAHPVYTNDNMLKISEFAKLKQANTVNNSCNHLKQQNICVFV